MRRVGLFYPLLVGCFIAVWYTAAGAGVCGGSCINRIPLLTGFYNLVQNNNRINASTSVQNHPPWNVRMSSNGWCSISLAEGDISGTLVQYLLVNFGAEVVVEAIGTAPANNGNYLQRYIVEYARSDGQFFNVSGENGIRFDGNSACIHDQTEQVRQFGAPVIAQYIRIVPVEWVGPMICFKMELYGCFVRECPKVVNLSDNRTLLPDANVHESSTYSAIVDTEDDVREAWCAQGVDNQPRVVLTFMQPLYITYAVTRGVSIYWLREYSYIITVGSSGRLIYSDVDGTSVYGQTNNGQYTVLFWEPIDATIVELRIDDYVPIFPCVGIKLYGCVSSEVIDHSIMLLSDATTNAMSISTTSSSAVASPSMIGVTYSVEPTTAPGFETVVSTVLVTITSTVHAFASQSTTTTNADPTISTDMTSSSAVASPSRIVASVEPTGTCDPVVTTLITCLSPTVTVTSTVSDTASQYLIKITPSNVQCSNQEITKESDSSCNALAICVPVAVVVALVACVIALIVVWRLRHKAIYSFLNSNPQMAKVYNDLYGKQNLNFSNLKGNEQVANKRVYDYPAFIPEKFDQSVTSNLADKAADSTTITKSATKSTGSNSVAMVMKNPLYVPTSKTQTADEETLNSDYMEFSHL